MRKALDKMWFLWLLLVLPPLIPGSAEGACVRHWAAQGTGHGGSK